MALYYIVTDAAVTLGREYKLTKLQLHTYCLIDSLSRGAHLCRLSQLEMAQMLDASPEAISRAIKHLVDLQLVIKTPIAATGCTVIYHYQAAQRTIPDTL